MTQNRRRRRLPEGVTERHQRKCASRDGGRCNCRPSYEARIFDVRVGKQLTSGRLKSLDEAIGWRSTALLKKQRAELEEPSKIRLGEALTNWIEAAEAGGIETRSGDEFKPSTLRDYRSAITDELIPRLGSKRLSEVRRRDVQRAVDDMKREGRSARQIAKNLMPLRSVYRWHIARGDVSRNPTANVTLPKYKGRRKIEVSVKDALETVEALDGLPRAVWSTAMFAGLRLGEMRALTWHDVNLADGSISVTKALDAKGEVVATKNREERVVPLTPGLRDELDALKMRTRRNGTDLVFGRSATQPFTASWMRKLAGRSWDAADKVRAEEGLRPLRRLGIHEMRHVFVSLLVASGSTLEQAGKLSGHRSGWMVEYYDHLLEGEERRTVDHLSRFLDKVREEREEVNITED